METHLLWYAYFIGAYFFILLLFISNASIRSTRIEKHTLKGLHLKVNLGVWYLIPQTDKDRGQYWRARNYYFLCFTLSAKYKLEKP